MNIFPIADFGNYSQASSYAGFETQQPEKNAEEKQVCGFFSFSTQRFIILSGYFVSKIFFINKIGVRSELMRVSPSALMLLRLFSLGRF